MWVLIVIVIAFTDNVTLTKSGVVDSFYTLKECEDARLAVEAVPNNSHVRRIVECHHVKKLMEREK